MCLIRRLSECGRGQAKGFTGNDLTASPHADHFSEFSASACHELSFKLN